VKLFFGCSGVVYGGIGTTLGICWKSKQCVCAHLCLRAHMDIRAWILMCELMYVNILFVHL
jgi:hypothetical protein